MCKSPKSWLLYISKEDKCPFLFGVRISELSLYARAWHHAKSTYKTLRPIDKSDPFLVGLGQYQRFGLQIIEQHLTDLREKAANARPVMAPNERCQITRELLGALEGVKHLYIVGSPGNGKTEVVDWYLRGKNYWKAGEPSSFLFGTLPDKVDYIWFEDFDMFKYGGHLNNLLSLMDHKETTISRKGVDDRTVICPARFVFISNFNVPSDYPMFQRRVQVVNVNHKMYNCHCYETMFHHTTDNATQTSAGEATVDELLSRDMLENIFCNF